VRRSCVTASGQTRSRTCGGRFRIESRRALLIIQDLGHNPYGRGIPYLRICRVNSVSYASLTALATSMRSMLARQKHHVVSWPSSSSSRTVDSFRRTACASSPIPQSSNEGPVRFESAIERQASVPGLRGGQRWAHHGRPSRRDDRQPAPAGVVLHVRHVRHRVASRRSEAPSRLNSPSRSTQGRPAPNNVSSSSPVGHLFPPPISDPLGIPPGRLRHAYHPQAPSCCR